MITPSPVHPEPPQRRTYRRRHRLSRSRDFDAVYREGLRRSRWPLLIFGKPNNLGHHRLGLSVSRRVGNAVMRNRIKRRLREAFRLSQPDWPGAYDLVAVVRPHEQLTLDEYARLLTACVERIDAADRRRAAPR